MYFNVIHLFLLSSSLSSSLFLSLDISHFLSEPDLRLMKPAGSVVIAIADGSGQASQFVADIFLPIFIQQLLSQSQVCNNDYLTMYAFNLFRSRREMLFLRLL